jgi:hypothetical protein
MSINIGNTSSLVLLVTEPSNDASSQKLSTSQFGTWHQVLTAVPMNNIMPVSPASTFAPWN